MTASRLYMHLCYAMYKRSWSRHILNSKNIRLHGSGCTVQTILLTPRFRTYAATTKISPASSGLATWLLTGNQKTTLSMLIRCVNYDWDRNSMIPLESGAETLHGFMRFRWSSTTWFVSRADELIITTAKNGVSVVELIGASLSFSWNGKTGAKCCDNKAFELKKSAFMKQTNALHFRSSATTFTSLSSHFFSWHCLHASIITYNRQD